MTSLLDTLRMALATLRDNPLRSLLTLLGIVIGAATVVAMMSLTEGLRMRMTSDLAFLGAGSFQIAKFPAVNFSDDNFHKFAKRHHITREQGEALRGLPHVANVSIESSSHTRERIWTRERATQPSITVIGAYPEYELANAVAVAQGRFFSNVDVQLGRQAAFIGSDVADLLFPDSSPLGQQIRIRSSAFTVVGVAERRGTVWGLESKDTFVVIPSESYDAVIGKALSHDITVAATGPEDVNKAMDEVIAQMRKVRGLRGSEENDFEVFTNDSVSEMFDKLGQMVAAATFGICALALLVGGIGIMNIMLVAVSERTREIGVRMALGARRRRILSQFVIEAVTLSLMGGILGVLLGAGGAVLAREVWGIPASVPAWAVLLSLLSASGAGVVFGIYPAIRASQLDPVEAMRTE
jgi:putative ABC transport system permease protein